jgi:hypothetical protein
VAGLRTLAPERFDEIYSFEYPVTAHMVARTHTSPSHLPWVAAYRDPWRDQLPPDHPYLDRAERLPRALAREATIVATPSPTWAAHYGRLWGIDIAVLPNGHDGPLRERRSPDRPTLTYVGTYYAITKSPAGSVRKPPRSKAIAALKGSTDSRCSSIANTSARPRTAARVVLGRRERGLCTLDVDLREISPLHIEACECFRWNDDVDRVSTVSGCFDGSHQSPITESL